MATPAYSVVGVVSSVANAVFFAPPSVDIVKGFLPSAHGVDVEYGGLHRIVGTVKVKGTPNAPVVCRVRLFRMKDGVFIRETWSDADGNYVFDFIDGAELYFTVGFDHLGNYRAVIADNLVPEAMP